MAQTATITDKRQFTIPVETYRKLGFREGGKVIVSHRGNKMIVEDAEKVVDRLAGSVTLPKRFRGMPIDIIIRKAKEVYFKRKLKENIRKGYQEYKNGRAKTIETLLQELK